MLVKNVLQMSCPPEFINTAPPKPCVLCFSRYKEILSEHDFQKIPPSDFIIFLCLVIRFYYI